MVERIAALICAGVSCSEDPETTAVVSMHDGAIAEDTAAPADRTVAGTAGRPGAAR